jgi:hypothetical protein
MPILTFLMLLSAFAPMKKALGAPNNPPGPYQTTCQNVEVLGTTLTATCKNARGQLTSPSSLPNFDQCIGEIQNYDGQLHCNMGSPPPPGAYTETCRFIFTSGATLNANCKNAGGKWVAQTYLQNFNQCISEIQNYNGQLHCNMGSLPPPGAYAETCRYVFTSGTTLTANCKNTADKFAAQTFLPNFNRCIGEIQNYNGQLHCNMGSLPPSGTYMETCRYIFTSGTTLNATCTNAGGKWAPQTSLVRFDQCAGAILNVNGILHCGIP